MSMISIKDLTFSYDGSYDNVFEGVSLQLDTDWRLGLVGRNGRGKTTLLRLLTGKYEFSGKISAAVSFDYFPFEVTDSSQATGELLQSICPQAQEWELKRELSLLAVEEEALTRPFSTLSKGEQTKALLGALFCKPNNFLLIDEPTNHLDLQARRLVSQYLRGKQGFILVSHDRGFLDNCIDHVVSINKENIEVQGGNFSSWLYNKELQDRFELAQNDRLQKDIKKMTTAAKRTSGWADRVEDSKYASRNSGLRPDRGYIGHKAAKMMQRAKNIEARQTKAIEQKEKLLKNIEENESLSISPTEYHTSLLGYLQGVSVRYGERTICENVSFEINQGDRIALMGKNGSGKSSIIKLILGEQIEHSGELCISPRLNISYVSQDTAGMQGGLRDFAMEKRIDESYFKSILRKLGFERVHLEKNIEDLSGGQKKKVLLARSLCHSANLYIWDEPLNFIDLLSRVQIEQLITEHSPTMLFVEHDSEFCKNIATKIIEL